MLKVSVGQLFGARQSLGQIGSIRIKTVRTVSDSVNDEKHPIRRTLKILRNDMRKIKDFFLPSKPPTNRNDDQNERVRSVRASNTEHEFQTHCDVLVIGGAMTGSSVAYWLKKKARAGLNVVVLEKDPTYSQSSIATPISGLRHQYSLPENIEMSNFGAEFIRNARKNLDVDPHFMPHGCLMLASEQDADIMRRNSSLQNELGVRNELLTVDRLKKKFPWLNTDGVALGCHGLEREGCFDALELLKGLTQKATEFGALYVNAELTGFVFQNQADMVIEGGGDVAYDALDKAIVRMPNGDERTIKFAICVLATGAYSGQVARLARIGTGAGILRIPLPMEWRERRVHAFNTDEPDAPGLCTPYTIHTNGTQFRRDGFTGNYVGMCKVVDTDDDTRADVSERSMTQHFNDEIKPLLGKCAKSFQWAKLKKTWPGGFGYNVFDENGIVGPHAYYNNLYIATGFSGQGQQLAPAIGRAISELIIDSQFRTIDLTRLGFDRIFMNRPLFEAIGL